VDSQGLDKLISELKAMIPSAQGWPYIGFRPNDWRPVWAKAATIQQVFNSGIRYPTKELREQAWLRFNELRNEASERNNAEREHVRHMSTSHCKDILKEAEHARYSSMQDVIFFFDQTTVEDMKLKGRILAKAMKMLSERKTEMLGEHKKECFERFEEIKKTHDFFWERHKVLLPTEN